MNKFAGRASVLIGLAMSLAIAPMNESRAADDRQSLEELRNTVVNLLQALVDQGVISREKAEQMVKSAQDKAAVKAEAAAKLDEGAVRVPYVPHVRGTHGRTPLRTNHHNCLPLVIRGSV